MTAALTDPSAIPPLRLRPIPWPERVTVFAAMWRDMTLTQILEGCLETNTRVVFLLAGPYASERPSRGYWLEPAHNGWAINGYTSDPAQARYAKLMPGGGEARIDVRTSSPWFGHELRREQVFIAWRLLGRLLHGMFDPHAQLMGTPARTGLDLLQRSLPERGVYPVASADLRTRMHNNAPQGRMEILPVNTRQSCLAWVDARWQYAACVSNLPCGEVQHIHTHDYAPHLPAFYFGRFRAPVDWPYPFGILPELTAMESDGPRFTYPRDRHWHTGWFTGAECELAMESGWDVGISERISWDMTQPDPLRNWTNKLRRMRTYTSDRLVADATRHLLIDPIGAFARRVKRELHITPAAYAHTIPADAYGHTIIGDTVEWYQDAPMDKSLLSFQHPEWSWQVWGRSRVRLHKAAMRYLQDTPGGEIVAFRSDAFVVTVPPAWLDDGKIGTFRVKRETRCVTIPRNEEEYRELLGNMGQEEEDNG